MTILPGSWECLQSLRVSRSVCSKSAGRRAQCLLGSAWLPVLKGQRTALHVTGWHRSRLARPHLVPHPHPKLLVHLGALVC